MRAYKSTNGGATWTFDNTFSGTQKNTDKEMIWIDHSATSAFKDTIYACWHNGNPAYVNRRTGPAGSWGATPIQVSGTEIDRHRHRLLAGEQRQRRRLRLLADHRQQQDRDGEVHQRRHQLGDAEGDRDQQGQL